MSTDYKRLSSSDLVEELSDLEERLAGARSQGRLKALVQNLRIHQMELEMQNRELREAQQALEEARDRYADLYDFAPVGYMTLDSQGVIQSMNLTGASMLGRPRGELLDSPFSMRVDAGHVPAFFKHLSKALHGDGRTVTELALRPDSGEALWARLETVPSRSDGATVCRTAMIDITRQRQTDQSRRESEARLALIADNVPVLIGYVDDSRRFVFNNAAYERWFGRSRDYIHGRHVRDVLGQEAYDTLRPYIDAALAGEPVQFETEVPYRDAGARYISGSYIPHRDSSGEVVRQALRHVPAARNAIQTMSATGTGGPRLMLATEATREHIELAVFDNGPGLPDEVLAHLFEPFQTTRTDGMGLGLAICRTIVEAHGGKIRGENRPAGGAVFRIRLRRLDDSKQDWSAEHGG